MRLASAIGAAAILLGAVIFSGQPPPRPTLVPMVSAECYAYIARAFPITRLRLLPANVFSGVGGHYFDCYRERGGAGTVVGFVRS
jgi:hypothetical protein